ncbi:folic acid synthesis protein-like protein [Amylocarpus encephaloides]|uniref:Folic acid synthesis protein FOL1 n=1 Tax=Amylocarpus encephaloides TaxID=45428 RepID=A0A9P7Y963_9HELO|nr:folic acid synthesis protein-like protein [Amylocarpus encephaloides]
MKALPWRSCCQRRVSCSTHVPLKPANSAHLPGLEPIRHKGTTSYTSSSVTAPDRNLQQVKTSPAWTRKATPLSSFAVGQPGKLPGIRPRSTAYIALGSNLGDRIDWIEKACRRLAQVNGTKILRTSSLWETDPMYVLDQDKFINGVCEISTILTPIQLLNTLQQIETDLGREKVVDKGPRNIDLDILLYGNKQVDVPRLQIPHPLMQEREFVLRPLAELVPAMAIDPKSPWKTTQDYLNALPPSSAPMTTITPLGGSEEPIRALKANRKTRVMAIMNLTPDSFSDGGQIFNLVGPDVSPDAVKTTVKFALKRGASILDIGGQSTAPGRQQGGPEMEISRILPPIKAMRNADHYWCTGLISVDTYHAAVAEAAVEAGADIINDISAGQLDPDMLPTMARLGKTVCLMHMRGCPLTMNKPFFRKYPEGLIPTVAKELLERVAEAEAAGIYRWRIILDPGIGFAKEGHQALEILRGLDELRNWPGLRGLPWLLGVSRKSFIGQITGIKNAADRQYGTAAAVAASIYGGADIIRVHDVKQMAEVAKVTDAIWRV